MAEFGSTEWSLERKLANAEKRLRTMDTQAAAHRVEMKRLERERALAQTELANEHRRATAAYTRIDELRTERDRLIERERGRATGLVDLRAAIEDEGPRPDIHRKVMRETEKVWPTLMRAVRKLLDG